MLNQLRILYPQGHLIAELVTIKYGKYIVRALVQVDGVTIATGLAAAETVELAEDLARIRALTFLGIPSTDVQAPVTPVSEIPAESKPLPKTRAKIAESLTQNPPLVSASQTLHHPFHPVSLSAPSEDVAIASEPKPIPEPVNIIPLIDEHLEPEALELSKLTDGIDVKEITSINSSHEYETNAQEMKTEATFSTTGIANISEVISKTTVEIKRLGWTSQQGKEHLIRTYNKRGRAELSDQELLEFLRYLESQPTPED